MLRQKNDRDILHKQQPQINNNGHNIIPTKSVVTKSNIINNKLIFNTNKKLFVDPQNKAKLLKSRPNDYIYKDKPSHFDLNNYNYSNIYNPYIDHNKLNDNTDIKKMSETKYKYFQTPYMRYPYWAPLWMQYYDPYIKMYDLTVLVPVTNNKLGPDEINETKTYEKTKSSSQRNSLEGRSKFAPFIYPIPIVVKKKIIDKKTNIKTESNKAKSTIEKFSEFFRLQTAK